MLIGDIFARCLDAGRGRLGAARHPSLQALPGRDDLSGIESTMRWRFLNCDGRGEIGGGNDLRVLACIFDDDQAVLIGVQLHDLDIAHLAGRNVVFTEKAVRHRIRRDPLDSVVDLRVAVIHTCIANGDSAAQFQRIMHQIAQAKCRKPHIGEKERLRYAADLQ